MPRCLRKETSFEARVFERNRIKKQKHIGLNLKQLGCESTINCQRSVGDINIEQIMKNQTTRTLLNNSRLELKPKMHRYPAKRWGHTAVIHNKKLIIYGGKTGRMKEPVYRINCETYECQVLEDVNTPKGRESHSCSLIKDKMVVWGGCQNEKVVNDCWQFVFNSHGGYWQTVAQFPQIKPRESHSSAVLHQKFILIYGGSGVEEQIQNSFFIFNVQNSLWFQIKNVKGKFQAKIGCSMQVIGDNIYLFGGQMNENQYSNDIYQLCLNNFNFNDKQNPPLLLIEHINVQGLKPPPRSCHASVNYLNQYLLVLGGQGPSNGKTLPTLYNDMWGFNTLTRQWSQILYKNNNLFKPRSTFTANLYKNRILIFGGLVSINNFRSSDELFVLWLDELPQIQPSICNICKFSFLPPPTNQNIPYQPIVKENQNYFELGLKTFFKLSHLIKHPFQAIGLIAQNFNRLHTQNLDLILQPNKYILIKASGLHFSSQQFIKIISCVDSLPINQQQNPHLYSALKQLIRQEQITNFSYNVKLGCGKLGACIIICNIRDKEIQLAMINDKMVSLLSFNGEGSMERQDKVQQGILKTQISKYIDYEKLVGQCKRQGDFIILICELQKCHNGSSLLTLSQNMVIINNVDVNDNDHNTDQKYYLNEYLQLLFLKTPNMIMTVNSKPIYFQSLEEQFRSHEKILSQPANHFLEVKLQCSNDIKIGVMYYMSNRMIGRYGKHRQANVHGYVNIPSSFTLNLMNTRLQNSRQIDFFVKQIIDDVIKDSKKRKASVAVIDLDRDALSN